MPSQSRADQEYVTSVGKIMDLGPKAFLDERLRTVGDEDRIPKIGDWVLVGHLSGARIQTRGGHQLRLISDSSIEGLIDDPNAYVAHL